MPTIYISEEVREKVDKLCLLEHRSIVDELNFLSDKRLEQFKQAGVKQPAPNIPKTAHVAPGTTQSARPTETT